jgi:hypothetical protein
MMVRNVNWQGVDRASTLCRVLVSASKQAQLVAKNSKPLELAIQFRRTLLATLDNYR